MISFSIIAAVDTKSGIGKNGNLPWHLPADMKYFKTITTAGSSDDKPNVVIMGRKTWESIPENFRPLPGRLNIVLSRDSNFTIPDGIYKADSLDNALFFVSGKGENCGEVFVIGGSQIFEQAIARPECQKLFLTRLDDEFFCDTFFPAIPSNFAEVSRKGPLEDQGIGLTFCEYSKNPS